MAQEVGVGLFLMGTGLRAGKTAFNQKIVAFRSAEMCALAFTSTRAR